MKIVIISFVTGVSTIKLAAVTDPQQAMNVIQTSFHLATSGAGRYEFDVYDNGLYTTTLIPPSNDPFQIQSFLMGRVFLPNG